MSNYHFGDDYDLNYYPPEASDGMGGVDWDKVERVEIEFDVYVKERTCRNDDGWCSECGYYLHNGFKWCPWCGAKVVSE